MATYQADTVFTPVIPSFRGFSALLSAGLVKPAGAAGGTAALAFARQFAAKTKGQGESFAQVQKRIAAATTASAKEVQRARDVEAAAARKVAVEEAKLQELRDTGRAKTSQLLAAEDRLTTAQGKLKNAHEKTAVAVREESDALDKGQAELAASERAAKQADSAHSKLGRGLKTVAAVGLGALVAGGVAAGKALASSVEPAQKFEKQMSLVQVTLGESGQGMEELGDLAIDMGAKTSFSAQGASDAMLELAKGGMTSAEIQAGALSSTLTLATAGELELGEAATFVVNGLNAFGLSAEQSGEVAAALAGAADASTASVQSLGEGLAQTSAQAATVGLSLQDTTAALAALDNAGIKGSDAGTSLKTFLQGLIPDTNKTIREFERLGLMTLDVASAQEFLRSKGIEPLGDDSETLTAQMRDYAIELAGVDRFNTEAQETFRKLINDTGVMTNSFFDAEGNIRSMAEVSEVLGGALEGMTKEQKSATLTTLFGSDASRAAGIIAATGAEQIGAYAAAANDQAAAENKAAVATKGFAGAQEALTGGLETLQIQAGTFLLPALTKIMRLIADQGIPVVQRLVEQVGPKLVPALDGAVRGLTALYNGASTAFGFVRDNQGVFIALGAAIAGVTAVMRVHAAVMTVQAAGGVLAYIKAGSVVQGVLRAWTAVQWLLNAAMSANPIGLIIVAVAALVTGLVLAYRNSETFRNIVDGALRAVGQAGMWLWNNALKPAFEGIKTGLSAVGTGAMWLWTNAIQPAFAAITSAALWLWQNAILPAVTGIRGVLTGLGNAVRGVWTGYISPVFQLIGAIVRWFWTEIASPVFGWVGAKFLALGKALMSAYTTYVKAMFTAAGTIISWLWNTVARPVFGWIGDRWREVATGMRVIWTSVLKPALDAVGNAIKWLWENFFKPRLADIKAGFSVMGSALKAVWDKVISPAFAALRRGVDRVKSAFDTAVSGVKTAWDKIKGYARAPIAFVINTIINEKLIGKEDGSGGGFNKLAKMFGTDPIKQLPRFEAGGSVLGRGWQTGGTDRVPILADHNEHVWTKKETAAAGGHGAVARLRQMALQGLLPAFAAGGPIVPGRGNQHRTGYPWATWAGDYPVPMGTPVKAWKDGVVAQVKSLTTSYGKHMRFNADDGTSWLIAHLSRFAATVGQRVKQGVVSAFSGSTGNSTGPHVHGEFMGGQGPVGDSGSGSGLGDMVQMVKDLAKGPVDALRTMAGGPVGQIVAGVPKKLVELLKEKAGSVMTSLRDSAAGTALDVIRVGSGVKNWVGDRVPGLARDQLANAATIMDVAKQLGFGARGAKIALMTAFQESTLRNLAYGDRDSVGLFQQRAPWGSRADRMNPARSAGMFFNGGQGGQPGLRSKNWQSMGLGQAAQAVQVSAFPSAYDKWADEAQQLIDRSSLFDSGGFLQPGLTLAYNGTSKPEPVFTDTQWQTMQDSRARAGDTYYVTAPDDKASTLLRGLEVARKRSQIRNGVTV